MDKTIEIVVVAMVAISLAVGLIFMVRGQSDSFLNFAQGEQSTAKCDLWRQTDQTDKLQEHGCEYSGSAGTGSPGPQCGSITNRRNCEASGVCTWSGDQCTEKIT